MLNSKIWSFQNKRLRGNRSRKRFPKYHNRQTTYQIIVYSDTVKWNNKRDVVKSSNTVLLRREKWKNLQLHRDCLKIKVHQARQLSRKSKKCLWRSLFELRPFPCDQMKTTRLLSSNLRWLTGALILNLLI